MLLNRESSYQNIDDRGLEIQNFKLLQFNSFLVSKTHQNPLKHALNFISLNYNRVKRLKRPNSSFNKNPWVNRFYARIFASPLSYGLKSALKIELVQILKSQKHKMCKNVELLDSNKESEDSLNQSQTILVERKDMVQRSGRTCSSVEIHVCKKCIW